MTYDRYRQTLRADARRLVPVRRDRLQDEPMSADDANATILRAAQSILRQDGIERVQRATSLAERKAANAALLASVAIEDYFVRVDDVERPF